MKIHYKANIKSWEIKGLESYVKHSIVPKGLRITLLQIFGSDETLGTGGSLKLMNLLLEEERLILEKTSQKRKSTIEVALKLKGETDFQKKETELQNSIEKYTALLKERKHTQFVRDLTEFRENKAYRFLTPQIRTGNSDISSSEAELSDSEKAKKITRLPQIPVQH